MKSLFFISTILIGFSFSCKKETPLQTPCENETTCIDNGDSIHPSDYIMTYPGSWWKYIDKYSEISIDSCTHWEKVPITNETPKGNCISTETEFNILPIHTFLGKIKDNSIVYDISYLPNTVVRPLVFDANEDNTFHINLDNPNSNNPNYSWVNGHSKHLADYDSLLIQGQYYHDVHKSEYRVKTIYPGGPVSPDHISTFYFAKNIGLIKYTYEFAHVKKAKELVNHYIAPH